MTEISILIGGKAGDGIDRASVIITNLLNRLGYYQYVYREYPSIIRGGHTFSIIRAGEEKFLCHRDKVDIVLGINRETIATHASRLKPGGALIYDQAAAAVSDVNVPEGVTTQPIPLAEIIAAESAPPITRNSIMIGAVAKAIGLDWDTVAEVLRQKIPKALDENLAVARRGYDAATVVLTAPNLSRPGLPVLTGNEALGMGLLSGGLDAYIAYPMTPTSSILHFLAGVAPDFGLKVMHPESEIGVILMALGAAYTGDKVAVGTSGGGFCLMTEGFTFAGMAELPVVVILGMRPGPSTGLPTYSAQTELWFALHAGQGEFTRFVVAPGDAEESFYWAQIALNLANKHRLPAIMLTDKNGGEGTYSFDISMMPVVERFERPARDWTSVFKIDSYEHDENGITTEDAAVASRMQDMRLAKAGPLATDLSSYEQVRVYGDKYAETAVICWGSNKGVCVEVAEKMGWRIVQPIVMAPFPIDQFAAAMSGVKRSVVVENNATGQLKDLLKLQGFETGPLVAKYDGRAFSVEQLTAALTDKLGGDAA
jgi:2-oxoglutarate ferredoxin oxidoreductase subunit alpha